MADRAIVPGVVLGVGRGRRRCAIVTGTGDVDAQIDRAVTEEKLTGGDAEEIRRFAHFLEEAGPPPPSPDFDKARFSAAYKQYYPAEYARAVAEQQAKGKP